MAELFQFQRWAFSMAVITIALVASGCGDDTGDGGSTGNGGAGGSTNAGAAAGEPICPEMPLVGGTCELVGQKCDAIFDVTCPDGSTDTSSGEYECGADGTWVELLLLEGCS